METIKKILLRILKDITVSHTVTSIANEIGLSRVGAWKILKKLEREELIQLKSIGDGKTSASIIELNWNNILTEKNLELLLTKESQNNQRWIDNLKELEHQVCFLILFGSILHSPKEANDIDVLIIAEKNNLLKISQTILKIQKSQIKKIHLTSITTTEFKKEISNQNKIFIDAIKKGAVLFGQSKLIMFIKEIKK